MSQAERQHPVLGGSNLTLSTSFGLAERSSCHMSCNSGTPGCVPTRTVRRVCEFFQRNVCDGEFSLVVAPMGCINTTTATPLLDAYQKTLWTITDIRNTSDLTPEATFKIMYELLLSIWDKWYLLEHIDPVKTPGCLPKAPRDITQT